MKISGVSRRTPTLGTVAQISIRRGGGFLKPVISLAGAVTVLATAFAALPAAVAATTARVDVGPGGLPLMGYSSEPAVSADGRFVAFASTAPLVNEDANGGEDVYVRDRALGRTTLVTVLPSGGAGRCVFALNALGGLGCGDSPSISADGRFVAFRSLVPELVADDTNGVADVFVRDLVLRTTQRVSVDSSGLQGNNHSAGDGRDLAISADGRRVAFTSAASNLVAGDTNGAVDPYRGGDIFVHDTTTGVTERVNVNSRGGQANGPTEYGVTLSESGRFVLFVSSATNLGTRQTRTDGGLYLRDRAKGTTEPVVVGMHGRPPDGRAFPEVAVSHDGRYVAFASYATNLVPRDRNKSTDIFVLDRRRLTTRRVSVDSQGRAGRCPPAQDDEDLPTDYYCSQYPSISADGRIVAFGSRSDDLVPNDDNGGQDLFIHDRRAQRTRRVNVTRSGQQQYGAGDSTPSLSSDGRYVVFATSGDFLPGGWSYYPGIFIRGPLVATQRPRGSWH
jgi:Tol biopolymer transport system component